MIYGFLILAVIISLVLGLFLDIADLDDNNERY